MRFEIVEVQSSVLADLLLFGEFKQGVILLASEFIGNSVLFNLNPPKIVIYRFNTTSIKDIPDRLGDRI